MADWTNSPHPAMGGHVPHWIPAASESLLLKAAILHYKSFDFWEFAKWFAKSPSIFCCLWSLTIKKRHLSQFWGLLYKHRQTFKLGDKRLLVVWSVSWLKRRNLPCMCIMKKLLNLIENIWMISKTSTLCESNIWMWFKCQVWVPNIFNRLALSIMQLWNGLQCTQLYGQDPISILSRAGIKWILTLSGMKCCSLILNVAFGFLILMKLEERTFGADDVYKGCSFQNIRCTNLISRPPAICRKSTVSLTNMEEERRSGNMQASKEWNSGFGICASGMRLLH